MSSDEIAHQFTRTAELASLCDDEVSPEKLEAIKSCEEELKARIDNCDNLPSNILDSSFDLKVNSSALMHAAPGLFLHIMTRFPGQFERIVGNNYMAFPTLLQAAVDAGEKITLRVKGVENGYFPASFISFRRLERAQLVCDEADYVNTYQREIEAFEQCIQIWCRLGVNVNDRSSNGITILMKVLSLKRHTVTRDVIPFLLEMGAIPDIMSSFDEGTTPLHRAMELFEEVRSSDKTVELEILKALLQCGSPIDLAVTDHFGWTPLDYCLFNFGVPLEAVRLYLKQDKKQNNDMGAESILFDRPYHKNPILYRLAEMGNHPRFEELADLFISYGASVKTRLSNSGKMPFFRDGRIQTGGGPRVVDAILENTEKAFSEKVVKYFRRKKG